MLIGIDLDNTIINYNNIYKSLLDKKYSNSKINYKNILKKKLQSISLNEWTNIQGKIYGKYISKAKINNGFINFLNFVKKNKKDIEIVIISHKTKYPIIGKKYDLHKSAINFLNKKIKFFSFKINKNIYFENTINGKINRIRKLDCDIFIDDLEKILTHKNFPEYTEKVLYGKYKNWKVIHKLIQSKLNLNNNNNVYTINNGKRKIFVKKFRNKNFFNKELEFYNFLKRNDFHNFPKILNFSKKKNIIRFEFLKKNTSLQNIVLLQRNIEFLKKINLCKFNKKSISFAKDFKSKGKSYLIELKKRLSYAKSNLKSFKKFTRSIFFHLENKIKYLHKIKYFDNMKKVQNENLIISPCDFHYKNMIINNKKVYYFDFEYSGLDDLAKVISVNFLQPEKNIPFNLFIRLKELIKKSFPKNKDIIQRIQYLFPIIYLRWILIIMNKINDKNTFSKNVKQIKKINFYIKSRKNYFENYKEFV